MKYQNNSDVDKGKCKKELNKSFFIELVKLNYIYPLCHFLRNLMIFFNRRIRQKNT